MAKISKAERRRIADQYRELIAALGLSQIAAAEFLGISPRQSRRWALGETVPDVRAEIVLRLMVAYDISVDTVNRLLKRKDLKK
jgi:transcriptional regulator with XRE-family HTH domain